MHIISSPTAGRIYRICRKANISISRSENIDGNPSVTAYAVPPPPTTLSPSVTSLPAGESLALGVHPALRGRKGCGVRVDVGIPPYDKTEGIHNLCRGDPVWSPVMARGAFVGSPLSHRR